MIHLIFLLPLLKAGTGVSYPVDFLDRFVTCSFTKPEKKFGFFYELPSNLRFLSIIYNNFSFESDAQSFISVSAGTYAEKASLSFRGKLIFLDKRFEGAGMGFGFLQAPLEIFSFGFYGEGGYFPKGNRTTLYIQAGASLHKKGFAINIEPGFTPETLGVKTGITYLKKLNSKYIKSLKLFFGFQIFKKRMLSAGIRLKREFEYLWFGFMGKKVYIGFAVDFKKRYEIREIVKVEKVPVYIEKEEKKEEVKKKKKKKRIKKKKEEKKVQISEEELEYYYKKGIEYYKMELLEEAIKSWEKIIKIKPDYKDTKKLYDQAKERLEKLKRISE